ncbi:MAG: hypothetical protein A4E19_06540 [Nitrospira sp. SG-bin1]|nr:MAG: hypothetical protein A4E19_06540 [Nitrospira sp. SG-bin1]
MVQNQPAALFPDPVIERYKHDVDRTLLRENLKLSVEQRFRQLHALQQFAAELKRAPRSTAHDRL